MKLSYNYAKKVPIPHGKITKIFSNTLPDNLLIFRAKNVIVTNLELRTLLIGSNPNKKLAGNY